jgi:hypothetical protein
MTSRIEFNAAAADDQNAPVGEKLIANVAPLFNSLLDQKDTFTAVTDVDAAVSEWEPSTEDDIKLAKQVEQAKALIAKNEAVLAEKARAEVLAAIAPDFDEAKARAKFNDDRATLVDWLNSTRQTFDMIGFLKSEVTDKGRRHNWQGVTPDGEKLIEMFANLPKLDSKGGSSTEADTPEKEAAREERKQAKAWARANGEEVADKGQIAKELLERYRAAGSPKVA